MIEYVRRGTQLVRGTAMKNSTSSDATTISNPNSNATLKVEGLIGIGRTYWVDYIKRRIRFLLIASVVAAEIITPLSTGLIFAFDSGTFDLPASYSVYWIIMIISM